MYRKDARYIVSRQYGRFSEAGEAHWSSFQGGSLVPSMVASPQLTTPNVSVGSSVGAPMAPRETNKKNEIPLEKENGGRRRRVIRTHIHCGHSQQQSS